MTHMIECIDRQTKEKRWLRAVLERGQKIVTSEKQSQAMRFTLKETALSTARMLLLDVRQGSKFSFEVVTAE